MQNVFYNFFLCHDVVFDWKADLTGTGDRSVIGVCCLSVKSNFVKVIGDTDIETVVSASVT